MPGMRAHDLSRFADTVSMSENVDRRLLEHWREQHARHTEEQRFLVALAREGTAAGRSSELFADQLAELRARIARQRAAAGEDPWDEPA